SSWRSTYGQSFSSPSTSSLQPWAFPPSPGSGRHALQASAFAFAHSAPHSVPLVPAEGVVEALDANGALRADTLRLARRTTLLREEDLRVVLPAPGPFLPWDEVMHRPPPELHFCNSEGNPGQMASPWAAFFSRLVISPFTT